MNKILPSVPVSRCRSAVLAIVAILTASLSAAPPAFAEPAPMRATAPAVSPHGAGMPGGPHPGGAAAPAAPVPMTRGKVLETMDASTYTYVRVKTDDGEKWIAGPQTALKVGDMVAWSGGSEMPNFPSKALGRTFDTLLLVDSLVVGDGTAQSGAPSPHAALSGKAADTAAVEPVARAEGGLTVGEIYDRRASLEGKDVVVRGKVVKYNAGVMGHNWLHLRDGSHGEAGDNDLTVTTDGEAALGDVVTVKGKVVLNKDFGFNYRYAIMVENATVSAK